MATKFVTQTGGGDGSDNTHPLSIAQFNAGTGIDAGDTVQVSGAVTTQIVTPKTALVMRADFPDMPLIIPSGAAQSSILALDKSLCKAVGFNFSIPDDASCNGIYLKTVTDLEVYGCDIYCSDEMAIYSYTGGIGSIHDNIFNSGFNAVGDPAVKITIPGSTVEDNVFNCGTSVALRFDAQATAKRNAFVGGSRRCIYLTSNGSLVEANTFDNNGVDILYPDGIAGAIEIAANASANKMLRNIIRNCYLGIIMNATGGTDENIAAFNFILRPVVNGITITDDAGVGFNHAYHNTIIHSPRAGNTPAYVGHAIACQNNAQRLKAANNLICIEHVGEDTHGLFITDEPARVMAVHTDYNAYCGVAGAAFYRNDGVNYSTIADIRANAQADAEIFGMDGVSGSAEAHSRVMSETIPSTGKISATSKACRSALVIAGINDAGQLDPWGNATPALPNIGADQQDYATGFGPWSPCDGILPTSAQPCKSHTLPIGVGKITVFPGIASQGQIEEAK